MLPCPLVINYLLNKCTEPLLCGAVLQAEGEAEGTQMTCHTELVPWSSACGGQRVNAFGSVSQTACVTCLLLLQCVGSRRLWSERARLCSSRTLFTETCGGPDLAAGHSLPVPLLECVPVWGAHQEESSGSVLPQLCSFLLVLLPIKRG